VKEAFALRFLVEIFTCKKYVTAMNDAIVPLANAEEELLPHISSLRSTGVDIILEIINKINSFGDSNCAGSSGKLTGSTAMDMDSEDKGNEGHCVLVAVVDSAAEGINDENHQRRWASRPVDRQISGPHASGPPSQPVMRIPPTLDCQSRYRREA
jgi:E3 ubiquitin-protein ligase HUWE1